MNQLLTISEVAALTRLSKATIYAYVCRKQIPYIKLGTRTVFNEQDIENWVKQKSITSVQSTSGGRA